MEIYFCRNQDYKPKPQIGKYNQTAYLKVRDKQITPCDSNSNCGYLDDIVIIYYHHKHGDNLQSSTKNLQSTPN